jgi:hypothetical protein
MVAVAALAAAFAHMAIDALGDVVLAHDTYDDVAHDSRTVVAAIAAAALLGAAARSLYVALRSALGKSGARRAFRIARRARFVGSVVALSGPFVLAMEAADAAIAGRTVDDLRDLCGGSIALGATTTAAVALGVALAALAAIGFFCRSRTRWARALALLVLARRCGGSRFTCPAGRRRRPRLVRSLIIRNAAKRGPPMLLTA